MDRRILNGMPELTPEEKQNMARAIEAFYLDERDERIGIIEQQQLLDLFMDQLAPVIYNKALSDAFRWYKQMQDNLESDFYTLYKDVR